jgi:hypothetical protein
VLQVRPEREAPTSRTADVPPALKPVASDMDKIICLPWAIGTVALTVPPPLLSALDGIEMFWGVPKSCGGER